jgi:phosphoenolpyruvate carboxykinase (GTP)
VGFVRPDGSGHIALLTCDNTRRNALYPHPAKASIGEGTGRMQDGCTSVLRARMDVESYGRLMRLDSAALHEFVADAVALCSPDSVFVCTDSDEDIAYVRMQAIEAGEETPLATEGHTVHFDGYCDQGRDREATKYLVPRADSLSKSLNQVEREEGLAEVRGLLKGSMVGRKMIVRLLSLGPTDSAFSIPCVQCTDSFYVAHSEDLLYRPGYEQFRKLGPEAEFFRILHSAGALDASMVSAEPDKKRIYIDYVRDTIYSVNTQYAGNTVGLKKLALRLTIRKADREGWLAEHMFLMAVHGPSGRKTYFAGAFPSACGKTATAMLPGERILGDDIAYFRNVNGEPRAVNAESGIFGIIQNVDPNDAPVIYGVLTTPGEVIFSNVLVKNGKPYWLGMGCDLPAEGVNFSGPWFRGKVGEDGKEIPAAHLNARYAVRLSVLQNVDPELNNPAGVVVGGIIYGGRDSDCSVPVQQSFGWDHGIIAYGASLESETTFAILGQQGRREINLMSIQDFLAIPLGKYVRNNLDYGRGLTRRPLVFGVNYFLRDKDGGLVTGMRDKAVWVKWMELRVHGDAGAVEGPTGWLPRYEDLRPLFRRVLDRDYAEADYVKQFTLRLPENLAKLDRVEAFYRRDVPDAPAVLYEVLQAQRERINSLRSRQGDYVSPLVL